MEKREALVVIINSLQIIPDDLKLKLIETMPTMSDEVVESIGQQLAALKAHSIQEQRNMYENFAKFVDTLDFQEE
jgi:hypothetical protein